MRKTLSRIALAAAAILLLGSCSKINERIDGLERRIDGLENETIKTIDGQISSINSSIADLGTIRSNIQDLKSKTEAQAGQIGDLQEADTKLGKEIETLEAADEAIGERIGNLQKYVDDTLKVYATTEWVNATFSTLAQFEATCDTIAKIDARIGNLDTRLSKAIEDCADSLKVWVNVQLSAYYTAAQMDATVAELQAAIDTASAVAAATADSLSAELSATKAAIDTAKANIRTEYRAAIDTAIKTSEGKLTKALQDSIARVNEDITALTGRVDALETTVAVLVGRVAKLEAMIQSVAIVPAYSDGSVKVGNDSLYIDCIITPATAVADLTKGNVKILVNKVLTKAFADVDIVSIKEGDLFEKDAARGVVSVRVYIADKIPAVADSTITVALNIKSGISDFTTEFVGVTTVIGPTFKAVYDTNGGANILTFYYDAVDHSDDGIVYEGSTGDYYLFDGTKTSGNLWGYNNNRASIKSVVIDASVEGYSDLTSTSYMFQGMTAASDISGAEYLYVSNVTDMSLMFQNFGGGSINSHTTLNSVPDVSNWNTANVTNMCGMFNSYGNFSDDLIKVPDVSNWNTSNVTNMSSMFQKYGHESNNLNEVPDVSGWNTEKVTNMSNMFNEYGYSSAALTKVPDVSGWSTAKLTNLGNMFQNYGGLKTGATTVESNVEFTLDLSGWDLTKLTSGGSAFNLKPKTFNLKIPAKTGETANETDKWYYGDGTGYITPPSDKTFTPVLPGVFSVSATKKVHFSKGNLVATINDSGAPTAWKFATNQYDCLGEDGANKTIGVSAGDVDLFGWSTASTTYGISKSTIAGDYSGDFVDWGKNMGDGNTWRTLTKDEWTYLFNTPGRMVNSKPCYSNAMNGVSIGGTTYKGVFIYPDNYNGNEVSSSMTWDQINAAGIVFLPAASTRSGSSVGSVGDSGTYWSSTAFDSNYAYFVYFNSVDVYPDNGDTRSSGCSVRLIAESK